MVLHAAGARFGGHFSLLCETDARKADRDLVCAVVARNGIALEYAADALRRDRDVVLAAVRQTWRAMRHALCGEDWSVALTKAFTFTTGDYAYKKLRATERRLAAASEVELEEWSDIVAKLAGTAHVRTDADALALAERIVARVHVPGGRVAQALKRRYEEAFG
jgi:hypothetical protein